MGEEFPPGREGTGALSLLGVWCRSGDRGVAAPGRVPGHPWRWVRDARHKSHRVGLQWEIPAGVGRWQWDVSPSGQGQGWWQPVPPGASLFQEGVEGRMGLSPLSFPDLVTSLQHCLERGKTPPCHSGNTTTASAQPLPTRRGQFLSLEPCMGCRRIPPSLLSADSPPPPAWKIPLN